MSTTGTRAARTREERLGSAAKRTVRAEPCTLWRVAVPGVCRLIDDPERLREAVRRRPDASVVLVGRGRAMPTRR